MRGHPAILVESRSGVKGRVASDTRLERSTTNTECQTMKKLLFAAAALCCFAVPADAMNSKTYKCGDFDVKLAIVKDNGKVVGTNVYFRVKLRGGLSYNERWGSSGGTIY